MSETGAALAFTISIALAVASVEALLRVRSRPRPKDTAPVIKKEDFVFWQEWLAAAAVAVWAFLIREAIHGKAPTVWQLLLGLAFAASSGTFAGLIRFLFYSEVVKVEVRGEVELRGGETTIPLIIVANIVGLALLCAAIVVGVRVYA